MLGWVQRYPCLAAHACTSRWALAPALAMIVHVQPHPCLAAHACICRCCISASHHLYKVPYGLACRHHVHPVFTSAFVSSPKSLTHTHSFSCMCAWMNARRTHPGFHACITHCMHEYTTHISWFSWYEWMHDAHTLAFYAFTHEHMTSIHGTHTLSHMRTWIHDTHIGLFSRMCTLTHAWMHDVHIGFSFTIEYMNTLPSWHMSLVSLCMHVWKRLNKSPCRPSKSRTYE
jgi:hypothetical protein